MDDICERLERGAGFLKQCGFAYSHEQRAMRDAKATIESLRAELAEVLKESIALRCLLGGGCDANDDGPHETIVGKGRDKFCAKCGEMLDSKDRSKPWFHGGRLERAKARNERELYT